ncbi:MAG: 3-phosphoshikimate 1-carboxyvinyltransferase [Clostridiales bacterium]|jgi:3-phosphoshikimate 1-carboxyvinyltransferase|nr:3-phosphoshikimate 1-carboxyvinyltransferase [Clostridiales bacterium]
MTQTLSYRQGLKGVFKVPGDKSISHRAVMLGAISVGETVISGFLPGEDCLSTINCFEAMGIKAERSGTSVRIEGNGLHGLKKPEKTLDVGNSGTTLRLMTGILAGQPFNCRVTGDSSIQKRPMKRVFEPLGMMGAKFSDASSAPFEVYGQKLTGIEYALPVPSAQVKSAILLASLFAQGETAIEEPVPSRNHTEIMLGAFGADIQKKGGKIISRPVSELKAQNIAVPGDISSAAFFMAAALITPGSKVTIEGVGVNPTRTGLVDALLEMGGRIEISNSRSVGGEPVADLTACHSRLKGISISGGILPRMIDEVPIFAAVALFAEGRTSISDAGELKFKESNRLNAMAVELGKLGAHVIETDDGLIIDGGFPLHGAPTDSRDDHRVAMSLAIASIMASGSTVINGSECVDISYPGFFEQLASL